jgi:molybdopterin-containing oxidoreductase family membrane subunit
MSHIYSSIRKPLVIGDKTYHDVTVDVAAPVEGKANKHWWIVFSIALTAFLGLGYCLHYRNWNMGIKQLVGLGYHKLCLVGWYWSWNVNCCTIIIPSRWRMAINRSAEAMTIFSVIQAGLFQLFTWVVHG